MNCPICGKENPDDARECRFCKATMTNPLDSSNPVNVRVSRLAITAIVFALCGLIFTFVGFLIIRLPRPLGTRSPLADMFFFLSLLSLFIALILGIISLTEIWKSGGEKTGRNFAVGAILT